AADRTRDRPAARMAGGRRQRAGGLEGSGARINWIGTPPAGGAAGRRSLAVARAVDRRRPAVDEFRAAAAGAARLRAERRLDRSDRAASTAVQPGETGVVLR